MDNRNRDKMSKESMESGKVNRETPQKQGNVSSESDASFGQNIGKGENLESEPSRSGKDEGYKSSGGRQSNLGEQSSGSRQGEGEGWGAKGGH